MINEKLTEESSNTFFFCLSVAAFISKELLMLLYEVCCLPYMHMKSFWLCRVSSTPHKNIKGTKLPNIIISFIVFGRGDSLIYASLFRLSIQTIH